MHRKTATVPPPLHYPNRLAAQQPAPLKQPQHPLPHCCLHWLHTCFIHLSPAKRQPLPPCATTPSSMHKCKCTCAFSVAPKRCTNNTPPLRPAAAVLVLAPTVARCTSRIAIPATRFKQSEARAWGRQHLDVTVYE